MNAQDIRNAAETLDREMKRFDGMQAAAKVLHEAATLESRIEEAERRVTAAGQQAADAESELLQARSRVEAARSEAHRIELQGKASAQDILSTAGKEGESILEKAKAAANDAIAKASADVDQLQQETKRGVAHRQIQIKQAAESLGQINEEIAARQVELAAINEKLNAARAQTRRLLEG